MGLIVIEGLDGAGKSTQISRLSDYLTTNECKCRRLHFPRTDTPVYGELISRFLRGELGDIQQVNPYLAALIYAGDRLDFKSTLENWLEQGDIVLLDRYVYSNIAYQCAKIEDIDEKRKLRDWILFLEFEYNCIPKPDLNIFLDVPHNFTCKQLTSIERKGDEREYLQGKKDIHETDINFQKSVRQTYLSMSETDNFVKIDCSDGQNILSVDKIFTEILNLLNKKNIFKK